MDTNLQDSMTVVKTGFKSIIDLLQAFPDEQSCIDHLERIRWDGEVISPFDPDSQVYKCKGNRYKCRNTNKYFNVKTGTIFEDSKIPLRKWYMALYIFSSHKKGLSSHQLARDIDVTQKTAWFILHRLRYAFDHPAFKKALFGEVEIDETYMGGNEKNKHVGKRTKGNYGGKGKTAVIGMIQRGGNVIAQTVDSVNLVTVLPMIWEGIEKNSLVYTDEHKVYHYLNRDYNHIAVNHSGNEYVNGMAHTNDIECFWSHMKRGIDGIYHWVSVKHLPSYIDEYELRFNTRKTTTCSRFDLILENMTRRLRYKDLINKAEA